MFGLIDYKAVEAVRCISHLWRNIVVFIFPEPIACCWYTTAGDANDRGIYKTTLIHIISLYAGRIQDLAMGGGGPSQWFS